MARRCGDSTLIGGLAAMIAAAVLVATLMGLPGSSLAAPWSAASAAGYGLDADLSTLRVTRELMARRGAQRAALLGSVRVLSREIGVLRQRAEHAGSVIAAQHDALRRQEEEQDRIVPRLVARGRALEQRRAQAARALADLAGLSRRRELAPALRARLSAIGPALMTLLRSQDSARAALARQRDRLSRGQDQRVAKLPILRAEAAQAQQRRRQLLEQRRRALSEIAGLDSQLHRLARTSLPLARRMVVIAAAHGARAEPQVGLPAHDRPAPQVASAVRGQALRLQDVAVAAPPGNTRAVAAAGPRQRLARRPLVEPNLAVRVGSLPAARPLRGGHLAASAPASGAGGMALVALSSRLAPARLALPAPIRPSPEVAMARFDDADQAPGVMIAAAPGQRVAAPQEGRIVFADAFKSYGLLLIIEHDSEYHTLLWGFSKLRVGVGDKVTDGEIIGVMDVVDGVWPRLGVELRRKGRPVSPFPWLAASSSKVRG